MPTFRAFMRGIDPEWSVKYALFVEAEYIKYLVISDLFLNHSFYSLLFCPAQRVQIED
jgi:hypothetical protein